MKMKVFSGAALCSRVEIEKCFGGAYCLRHQDDLMWKAVNTLETSVNCYRIVWRLTPRKKSRSNEKNVQKQKEKRNKVG
jgi:hypothetical protein